MMNINVSGPKKKKVEKQIEKKQRYLIHRQSKVNSVFITQTE